MLTMMRRKKVEFKQLIFPINPKKINNFIRKTDTSSENEDVSVDDLMARMKVLSEKPNECNEVELSNRFKNVEQQVSVLLN